jgi:maltose alpha-D-glucosyltransferase/alpha-amylase
MTRHVVPSFVGLFARDNRTTLENILIAHMTSSTIGRPRATTRVEVVDLLTVNDTSCVAILQVSFTAGDPELKFLPLSLSTSELDSNLGSRALAELRLKTGEAAILYLDVANGPLSNLLLQAISSSTELKTERGSVVGSGFGVVAPRPTHTTVCLLPDPPAGRQHNVSVLLGYVFVLKLFRDMEAGKHPELDAARFLFEDAGFSHMAPVMGSLRYVSHDGATYEVGALHAFVENRTDLWHMALDELSLFLERASTQRNLRPDARDHSDLVGTFLEIATLLGKRTAQMHVALKGPEGSGFEPEPFDRFYLRGACHAMTSRADMAQANLQNIAIGMNDPELANQMSLALEALIKAADRYKDISDLTNVGLRIHVHGNLHFGQVLYTGTDIAFIDFEGDHGRPLHERRLKTSPLIDVAGLTLSFLYVALSANFRTLPGALRWHGRTHDLLRWTLAWAREVVSAFLTEYRGCIMGTGLAPEDTTTFDRLLRMYLVDKAVYQLIYELERRIDWAPTAIATLVQVTSDGEFLTVS